ncbi:hypothetical protein M431DRAFT_313559 [Trichoderma harzianum CBS 226.95]|uniref:Uncharacterized protein n=1 Tax=Trichoderma harzianum CBS 226.95 TaxID=983964 RepID=A0A2T4ARP7_TRIHA|nr:hypothetical protein M431DRAFT_313559 [Trichoderma harzianum CBS 226.95]PTB59744.1 hypothetical protein M431DRAFT_313559 [Trichoderma harzianum CBS 226.95]
MYIPASVPSTSMAHAKREIHSQNGLRGGRTTCTGNIGTLTSRSSRSAAFLKSWRPRVANPKSEARPPSTKATSCVSPPAGVNCRFGQS